MEDIDDVSSPPIPSTRRRSTVTTASVLPPLSVTPPFPSAQPVRPGQRSLTRQEQQAQALANFDDLHQRADKHKLEHLGHKANGLDDPRLTLWSHALKNVPLQQAELREFDNSVNDLRLQADRTTRGLESAKDLQEAKEKLDAANAKKSIEQHKRTVQAVQKFLTSNPSVVTDLQSAGIDFGAVSREALQSAEAALNALQVKNCNTLDNLQELQVEVNSKSSELESLQELLSKKSETIEKLSSQRDEARAAYHRLRNTNEHLTRVIEEKDKGLAKFEESFDSLNEQVAAAQESQRKQEELNVSLRSRNLALQNQSHTLQSHTHVLQNTVAEKDSTIEHHEQSLDDLRQSLNETQETLRNIQDLLKAAQADGAAANHNYSDLQSRYLASTEDLEEKLNVARRANQDLTHRNNDLQTTVSASSVEINGLKNDLQSTEASRADLAAQHTKLRIHSDEIIQQLRADLVAAEQRIDELTSASHTQIQKIIDVNDFANDMSFEAKRLNDELLHEKAFSTEVLSSNISLKRERSDLQDHNAMLEQKLKEASETFRLSAIQQETTRQSREKLIKFLLLFTMTLTHKLSIADNEIDLSRKRLRRSEHELSKHQYCEQDRNELEELRRVLSTHENNLMQQDSTIKAYQNWLSLTHTSNSDESINEVAFEKCLKSLKPLTSTSLPRETRRDISPLVHGLTYLNEVTNICPYASEMLTKCCSTPCKLELAQLYSLESALPNATLKERGAALTFVHAILNERLQGIEPGQHFSTNRVIFILVAIEMLFGWLPAEQVVEFELKKIFDRVRGLLDTNDILVAALSTLTYHHMVHGHHTTLSTILISIAQSKLTDNGYTYIKYGNDILVTTPQQQVVFVPTSQCTVQTYDRDDPSSKGHGITPKYQIVVHDVPLLGTFKSCYWTLSQVEEENSVFYPVLERRAEKLSPAKPPESVFQLIAD